MGTRMGRRGTSTERRAGARPRVGGCRLLVKGERPGVDHGVGVGVTSYVHVVTVLESWNRCFTRA
jgi:hypothetical protein